MKREEFESKMKYLIDGAGGAAGVSVLEMLSAESYGYNEDWIPDNPASTVKLGLLCAALHKVQEGELSLEGVLKCFKKDMVPGSGILWRLSDGVQLSLRDLLVLMIIQSDNTATNLVIDAVGTDYVNNFFDISGIADIRVNRKMFDAEAAGRGVRNIASARALTALLRHMEQKIFLNGEFSALGLDMLLKQQHRSKIPKYIMGCWDENGSWRSFPVKVGNKTGEDDNAQHDCGIIYTPESTIAVSVMTQGMFPPKAIEFIGRVAELAVLYFDPGVFAP